MRQWSRAVEMRIVRVLGIISAGTIDKGVLV